MADSDRWLTVDELAVLRGIDRSSAQRLVRRKKWPKQPDNHGIVRIHVPDDAVQPDTLADVVRSLKALEAAVTTGNAANAALREQLVQAEARAEREAADRRAAEAARVAAEAAAEQLRQADAARRARSLLARLAAAVRGE